MHLAYFGSILVLTAVVICIHDVRATTDSTADWGVNPERCRAEVSELDVRCRWTPPPSEPSEDCQLFFRSIERVHLVEPFCRGVSNWTICPHPEPDNVCYFPEFAPGESSVYGYCGENIEMRVQCRIATSDAVVINNRNITQPPPVVDLSTKAVSTSSVIASWAVPPTWVGLGNLDFVVESWDEFSDKWEVQDTVPQHPIYGYHDRNIPYTHGIDVGYAYAETCVRVGTYYDYNPLRLKSWSNHSCTRTKMSAPSAEPTNVTVVVIGEDGRKGVRMVNVTWAKIPEEHRGGSSIWYDVFTKEGDTINTRCSAVEELHCVFEVGLYSSYTFIVVAANDVGESDHAVTDTLYARPLPKKARHFYLFGILVAIGLVFGVLVSSFFILRKKMRASHLPEIKFPEKVVTIQLMSSHKEQEVFDALETRTTPLTTSDTPLLTPHPGEGDQTQTVQTIKNKHHTHPIRVDIPDETARWPLAMDAYPTNDGDISPTDSGHCGYHSESGEDNSPIPMSFPPPLVGGRGRNPFPNRGGMGVADRSTLAPYVGDDAMVPSGAPPAGQCLPVCDPQGGQRAHSLGQTVSAGPTGMPRLEEGSSAVMGTDYSPQSGGVGMGYVRQSLLASPAPNHGITADLSYVAAPEMVTGNETGSSIPSYVQHSEASEPHGQVGGGGGGLPTSNESTPTSGGSVCPPYVKQA